MANDIAPSTRCWLEGVLTWLGLPDSQRQESIASATLVLRDVVIKFLDPPYGDRTYLVARAVVGDVPPPGCCEPFFQLVLEVQAMLCGPHTPMLGLDWPDRKLLVQCSLDIPSLSMEEAAAILRGMHQMAMEWRQAIAKADAPPSREAVRVVVSG